MCTVNITFEVPESKGIDIEALRANVHAYVKFLVSYPSILKMENKTADTYTERMLERFAGCWHGDETAETIMSQIKEGRTIREPLTM